MEVTTMQGQEKAELEAILASEAFAKSPNLAKLLSYICEKYWEGKADQLKEYSMGVEVLGRPSDFDPTTSAIVRVEIHRLREKLRKYYENEGASHRLSIVLQPGHYTPQFITASDRPGNLKTAPSSASGVSSFPSQPPPGSHSENSAALPRGVLHGLTATRPAESTTERALAASGAWQAPEAARRSVFNRPLLLAPAALGMVLLGLTAVRHFEMARKAAENAITPRLEASAGNPAVPHAFETNASPVETAIPAAQAAPGMRIIAGYTRKSYIDRSGSIWQGDAYFDGGGVDLNADHFIFRTSDPTLFQTDRHGEFSYNVPLKPGSYELWLYFVETDFGPGTILGGGETSRLFDVQLNGRTTLLDAFDVFADAGGNFTADVRVFKDVHPEKDGYLRISFLRRTGDPFVNAIRIVPGIPGELRPIRIVAQDDSYTDRNGEVWNPDNYFRDGRTTLRRSPVSGTDDPGLFDGERYGNFDYAIPVAEGKYTVSLYFSERYFGPEMPGGGGAGSRVFDVVCNGNTLLKNFDIFKSAGGADRAIVRNFHGIKANAQGKLVLRFVPVVNYALVDAIEVTDEGQ
jgi:hypothetical protein